MKREQRVAKPSTLFHLLEIGGVRTRRGSAERVLKTLVLEPHRPQYVLLGQNKTTKRVSMAETVRGALIGLEFWSAPNVREWRIYTNAGPVKVIEPPGSVADAEITGEWWSLQPVGVRFIGIIQADDPAIVELAELANGIEEEQEEDEMPFSAAEAREIAVDTESLISDAMGLWLEKHPQWWDLPNGEAKGGD